MGQLAREGGGKCSLESAVENWRSLFSAPILLPLAGPVHRATLCPAQKPSGTREEQVQQPGLWAFLGGDRRCRLTPALPKPQLAVQSSVGGWEPVTEGQKGSGQGGQRGERRAEDEDVHAHSGEVRGGHRFWQHCSLLGFCPSVVGGTLMSTTLLPGDSSCAARSAICFCDTMR